MLVQGQWMGEGSLLRRPASTEGEDGGRGNRKEKGEQDGGTGTEKLLLYNGCACSAGLFHGKTRGFVQKCQALTGPSSQLPLVAL
jgi:hypothetical protein